MRPAAGTNRPVRVPSARAPTATQQSHAARSLLHAASPRSKRTVCRATVDDPEIQELVKKLDAMTPPPPEERDMLDRCVEMIDEANAQDPTKVPVNGVPTPYRLAYSDWLTRQVLQLQPKASDELLILARGKSVQSWNLAKIRRDDYAPNAAGQRQWEMDRKKRQAEQLTDIMTAAGYADGPVSLVRDVLMGRNVPDPRDVRKFDLLGPFGMVNYRTLQATLIVQTLADAEALVFLDKNFDEMFNRMGADEVLELLKRELSRMSQTGVVSVLRRTWSPVQRRLLMQALPVPFRFGDLLMEAEGVAAASTHPGDWRYRGFDYE